MGMPSRIVMLAAALLAFGVLPCAAQQSSSQPTGAPPAGASVETVAPGPDAMTDLQAMIGRLKEEVQRLSQSARDTTRSMMNGDAPIVITTDQLAVIAGGALAGAILADLLLDGGMVTLAGALAGGVLGHWIYSQPSPSTAGDS